MAPDLVWLVIYCLIAIVGFLIAELFRLNGRLRRLLVGKSGRDLEDALLMLSKGMENLDERSRQTEEFADNIDKRLQGSIQKVHTVRFNPFKDQGSNQSFATCFMDEKGNGVVISSLYSRDKVSTYAKPLQNYSSEYDLSEEEKQAIGAARSQ